MAFGTYAVKLWDHELDEGDGDFSAELAQQHLEGPATGLTWREIGLAIRKLYAKGWSEVSILVWREDE